MEICKPTDCREYSNNFKTFEFWYFSENLFSCSPVPFYPIQLNFLLKKTENLFTSSLQLEEINITSEGKYPRRFNLLATLFNT